MSNAFYELLTRLGYSHPVHPILVHMPVGLTVGAFCLCIAGILRRRPALLCCAQHLGLLALLFLVLAVPIGIIDWRRFYGGAWLFEIKMKLALAATLLILLILATVLGRQPGRHAGLMPTLYFLGVLNVGGLGFFGGELVYRGRVPEAPDHLRAGQLIFDGNCSGCHNRGGNAFMPNLPLRSAPQLQTYAEFRDFVRDPRLPNGQPGPMPAFGPGQLSDAQLQSLYDYVQFAFVKPQRDGQ